MLILPQFLCCLQPPSPHPIPSYLPPSRSTPDMRWICFGDNPAFWFKLFSSVSVAQVWVLQWVEITVIIFMKDKALISFSVFGYIYSSLKYSPEWSLKRIVLMTWLMVFLSGSFIFQPHISSFLLFQSLKAAISLLLKSFGNPKEDLKESQEVQVFCSASASVLVC